MAICPKCRNEAGEGKLCRICGAEVSAGRPPGDRVAGGFHAGDIGFIKGNVDASVHINKCYVNVPPAKQERHAGPQEKPVGAEEDLDIAKTIVPGEKPPAIPRFERLEVGSLVSGRYLIVGFLGRGGMGEVYHAKDQTLDNLDVALKFLAVELVHDRTLVERFKKEVVNAKRLGHANVVRVFDIGQHEDRPFLSMELVNGPTLRGWLAKKKSRGEKVTIPEFMHIAVGLSAGLAHIHDHDVVHRDIKPENIKIEPPENPKIMDLGISKLLDYEAKRKYSSLPTPGTLSYMAPQQRKGEAPSFRDDVFACGAVFYEMLTGEGPGPGISLKRVAPHVPPKIAKVLDCCLDEDAKKRFAHGGELAAALRKAEQGGFWDGVFQKRKMLISVVGLLVLVVAGGVWYYRPVIELPRPPVVESRPPEEILHQAEEYINTKNYGPAIPLLEKLRDYQDGIALEDLGSIYHMAPGSKDLIKARTCYEEAYRAYHRRLDSTLESQRAKLIRPKLIYNLMCVESMNGDSGAALARLEEFASLANGPSCPSCAELVARLAEDPELDNIRQFQRFREIRQTIRPHHPE